jgi:hypothetical protein
MTTSTYVTTICIPETVYLPEPTGHLSWDFDPAALWDIIAWSDDGHICNMRVAPYDPMQYNPRIDFWTSESDNVPSNIVTQGREDFIDRFKECVEINNTRYGYIAGSNK